MSIKLLKLFSDSALDYDDVGTVGGVIHLKRARPLSYTTNTTQASPKSLAFKLNCGLKNR